MSDSSELLEIDEWLVSYIEDTIDMFADRFPLIETNNNYIVLDWPVLLYQDTLWDTFDNKQSMEYYFNNVRSSFIEEYRYLDLGIHYCMGPVDSDGTLYSRIILYCYEEDSYQNANTVFIA